MSGKDQIVSAVCMNDVVAAQTENKVRALSAIEFVVFFATNFEVNFKNHFIILCLAQLLQRVPVTSAW